MKQRLVVALAALGIFILIVWPSTWNYPQAQGDPTRQRQTLDAIVNPRLTLTARGIVAQTATSMAGQLATNVAEMTMAIQTLRANLTETLIVQTATVTPSFTPTSSPSPFPTHVPTVANATEQFQTIIANVNQRLTQTHDARALQTSTAAFQQTVNAVLFATLGITPTPGGIELPIFPPGATGVPLDATAQYQTLIADVDRRLTATFAAQQTVSVQRTIDAIIAGTLSASPAFNITATRLPSPTPNPTEAQQTLEAQVNHSLTQTVEAAFTQTSTAAFQGTISAIVSRNQTATSAVIQATLVVGVERITNQTATRVAEMTVAEGHQAAVRAVAFNGNGDLFASAGLDNSVQVWSTMTGLQISFWQGLTDRLSVAFSSDGSRVAASSSDGTIRLWDVATGAEMAVLSGHEKAVLNVAFSPDNRFLASSSADRTVRLWDAKTGRFIREFGGPRAYLASVTAVAFSPDSLLLAVGGEDGQVYLWEVSSGVQIARIRDLHRVVDIAFSPDGKLLATVGNSNAIVVYPYTVSGARPILFRAPSSRLNSVAFSPDGSVLVAGHQNGTVLIWDARNGRVLATLQGHKGAVTTIVFSPDGTRILTGSEDKTIRIWGIKQTPRPTP